MTTTAAVYPEVLAELERPDRIRRLAFRLLQHPEAGLHKIDGRRALYFETYYAGKVMRVTLPDPETKIVDVRSRAEYTEAIRSKVLAGLIELLESEPELVD